MDEKITSRDNPKVKYACKLADSPGFRRSEGRFFAEGRKLCPELAKGAALEQLFYTAAAAQKCPELAGLPGQHFLVEEHVAQKAGRRARPAGGVFGGVPYPAAYLGRGAARGGGIWPSNGVQDPGNVGTLIRSAAAFGFDGVILSEGCASPYAPKTLRASMGAAVRVPVIETGPLPPALARLRQLGIRLPGGSAGAFRTPWPGPGRAPRRGVRGGGQRGPGAGGGYHRGL